MTMSRKPFETLEGSGYTGVRQFSVFLENRVGQLLRLTQVLEQKNVKILAFSVIDSVDCAIVRVLFNDPDDAYEILQDAGFAVSITEVLVVALPPGRRALLTIFQTLLSSEINIGYTYPLIPAGMGQAVVLSVDNLEIAADTLTKRKFQVLGEADLSDDF
jgi:hypothetical protein